MKLANPPGAQFEILTASRAPIVTSKRLRSRPLNFSRAETRTAKLR